MRYMDACPSIDIQFVHSTRREKTTSKNSDGFEKSRSIIVAVGSR